MGLVEFGFVSFKAILQVILVAISGYLFARRGVLGPVVMKNVSILNLELLTPCLLFSKISQSLDLHKLLELWLIPVTFVVVGTVGLAFTQLSSRILGLPAPFMRFLDATVFFTNCNTLPFALIYSIATSPEASFLLRDKDDSPAHVAARGIMYAVLYGILSNALRFSLGLKYITVNDDEEGWRRDLGPLFDESAPLLERHQTSSTIPPTTTAAVSPYGEMNIDLSRESDDDGRHREVGAYDVALLASPAASGLSRRSRAAQWSVSAAHFARMVARVTGHVAESFMNGPMYGIIAAFVVISIPPLKRNVLMPGTVLYSVASAISMLGDACVPMTIMALGAQLGFMHSSGEVYPPSRDVSPDRRHALARDTGSMVSLSGESYTACPAASVVLEGSIECSSGMHHEPCVSQDAGASRIIREYQPSLRRYTKYHGPSAGDTCEFSSPAFCNSPLAAATTTMSSPHSGQGAQSISGRHKHQLRHHNPKRLQYIGVLITLFARFLVVPLVTSLALIVVQTKFPSLAPAILSKDPVLVLTLLLLSACPPAINLITISHVTGMFQDEAAIILFWSYLLGALFMALEISAFLWVVNTIRTPEGGC